MFLQVFGCILLLVSLCSFFFGYLDREGREGCYYFGRAAATAGFVVLFAKIVLTGSI